MKDIFGVNIEIGDEVTFNRPYYKNLSKGPVIKLTKQMVKIEYEHQHIKYTTNVFPENCAVNLLKKNLFNVIDEVSKETK